MGRRAEWVARGLCRGCGMPKRCGTYCDECRTYWNKLAAERYRAGLLRRNRKADSEAAKRRRDERKARSQCVQCGSPARLTRCLKCAVKREDVRRRQRAARRAGRPEYRLADLLREAKRASKC